jgi:iron complex outermembrane receptor protein
MSAALFTTAQPQAYVANNTFGLFGEQRNRGLELSVFGMPTRGLRLLGGADPARDANSAAPLAAQPRAAMRSACRSTQLNLGRLGRAGRAGPVAQRARCTPRASTRTPPTCRSCRRGRASTSAQPMTRVMERDVTLRARVDNVADKNYWASAGGYPNFGYLVAGGPRSVVVSATVDF